MTQLRNLVVTTLAVAAGSQLLLNVARALIRDTSMSPAIWHWSAGIAAAFAGGAAVWSVLGGRGGRPRSPLLRVGAALSVLLVGLRLTAPSVLATERVYATASDSAADVVSYLRELAASQEQYRLRVGRYAADAGSADSLLSLLPASRMSSRANAAAGWTATVSTARATCTIWVRDTALRLERRIPEGSPECAWEERRAPNQNVHTFVIGAPAPVRPFTAVDATGEWLQHRAGPTRSGAIAGNLNATWSATVGGELLSPAAVAGGQLFIGAHGNGEFVAIHVQSGQIGFRLRAPNWIHHEPVVKDDLVVVAFGNNEHSPLANAARGSDPSGVVAYDRITGIERWRRRTSGSAMSSPVIWDSVVVASVSTGETFGWKLRDGAELWQTRLPGASYMSNPLLLDSTVFISVEPTMLCAVHAGSGRLKYCRPLSNRGRGAGHASPAAAGNLVLQVYNHGVTIASALKERRFGVVLRQLAGIPEPLDDMGRPYVVGELVMAAVDARRGQEVWRTPFGLGNREIPGHLAGTPTVTDGTAYVPLPMNE